MKHLHSMLGFTMSSRYIVGPIMVCAALLASGSLIAGLSNADMVPNSYKQSVVKAKKLDENNDGLISLDELISRQNRRFKKLDRNDDGQIDKIEFNARLVAMFNRIDGNSDGMLDNDEISKLKNHHRAKGTHGKGL